MDKNFHKRAKTILFNFKFEIHSHYIKLISQNDQKKNFNISNSKLIKQNNILTF